MYEGLSAGVGVFIRQKVEKEPVLWKDMDMMWGGKTVHTNAHKYKFEKNLYS